MLTMLKKDFWYDLPKELIAQEPASPRDAARLMVLSQKDDSIQHRIFHDLPEYLEPGDLLVVNNSKVLPARIVGIKQPTGAVCELLLLRQVKGDQWECLAKPGKRMQPGTKVSFGDGSLTAIVDETLEAVAAKYGEIKACSGNTDIFLYPGVKFNCIDGLITNFHLPESTLIMLVSALYGYEKTMAAYKVAVEQKYRFFSFGDAMLIL